MWVFWFWFQAPGFQILSDGRGRYFDIMQDSAECDEEGMHANGLPPCMEDNFIPSLPSASKGRDYYLELYPAS